MSSVSGSNALLGHHRLDNWTHARPLDIGESGGARIQEIQTRINLPTLPEHRRRVHHIQHRYQRDERFYSGSYGPGIIGLRENSMKSREKWQHLANELGFEFIEGPENVLKIPAVQRTMVKELGGGQIGSIEKVLDSPIIRKAFSTMFIGAAIGRFQDRDFVMFRNVQSTGGSSGSRNIYFVNIISPFKNQLQYGLKVKTSGAFTGIGKAVFPGIYIRPESYPELDAKIVVKGKKKAEIKSFLFSGKRVESLLLLFGYSKKIRIDDFGIHFKEVGEIIDADKAKNLMEKMAATAKALD